MRRQTPEDTPKQYVSMERMDQVTIRTEARHDSLYDACNSWPQQMKPKATGWWVIVWPQKKTQPEWSDESEREREKQQQVNVKCVCFISAFTGERE